MSNKFKVGDKVRGYSSVGSYDGLVSQVIGDILTVSVLRGHSIASGIAFHYKECRKLKPRKSLREFYVVLDNCVPHSIHEKQIRAVETVSRLQQCGCEATYTLVREVRGKKK